VKSWSRLTSLVGGIVRGYARVSQDASSIDDSMMVATPTISEPGSLCKKNIRFVSRH
jgi:hypothetical protein